MESYSHIKAVISHNDMKLSINKNKPAFCENLSDNFIFYLDTPETLKAAIICKVYQWN